MGSANPAARGLGRRLGSLLLPPLLLLLLPAPGSSSRGTPSPGEIAGVPQVAGLCGRLTLHRDLRTGRWEPDPQHSRRCLRDPQHVLAYCRQVYPDLQIGRVEEASRPIPMERWCGGARGSRCPHHVVIPYHCLPGEFVSEALLVPEGCKFLHQERMDECEGSAYRHHQAQEACHSEGLVLHGSGMLLPCGTDRFRGVEYVCCPAPGTSTPPQTPHSDAPTQPQSPGGEEEEEEEEESFPQTVDDYFVEPPGEDEEDGEGETRRLQHPSTQPPSRASKGSPTARPTDGVDVYFGMPGEGGEHAGFLRAKMDLEERRMRQINEVMREWAEADNQARNLPKADRQALNEHFQSILQTLEEQVSGERQRLVETHAARVIALINDQRRAALEGFLAALQGSPPQAERVLQALKRYLRAEQKEQRHTIRHYQHVAAVDPEKAEQMRFQVQTHLQVIEERMNQSLGLLEQNPHLARELQPQIRGYPPRPLTAGGGRPADMGATMPLKGFTERDGAERLPEHKVNVSIPRGLPFRSPEIQRDELEPGMGAGTGVARGAVAGLLVVAVAVAAVVVLSLLVARRRRPYGAISHGVVEVDPMLSLEEQQLRELQRHGYENPTYRFLEERP
ncbi:amyloid beta precursor like protein 1 [Sminthopsis crassicaudata]|uniref:amyloid beta precursor like protein 1 n=1 Tax=Sminthopsis crassicaudata TaxID=9301 RepID=UPI003D69DAD2